MVGHWPIKLFTQLFNRDSKIIFFKPIKYSLNYFTSIKIIMSIWYIYGVFSQNLKFVSIFFPWIFQTLSLAFLIHIYLYFL